VNIYDKNTHPHILRNLYTKEDYLLELLALNKKDKFPYPISFNSIYVKIMWFFVFLSFLFGFFV